VTKQFSRLVNVPFKPCLQNARACSVCCCVTATTSLCCVISRRQNHPNVVQCKVVDC
jgi:hypothetical protein